MFDLLQKYPGVIVLHDYFLSGVICHRDGIGETSGEFSRQLQHGHGFLALQWRHAHPNDWAEDGAINQFSCNLGVLQNALGVIVHSQHAKRLAEADYGKDASREWTVIPHLRRALPNLDRKRARAALGLEEHDFVVCSFGFLGETKQNHRLLEAWLASDLAADGHCYLVFVGGHHGGEYPATLTQRIADHERIRITGFAEFPQFRQWLAAADAAVQLRTRSRGETSGTVLDCMNAALPVIVNAHGSMVELPTDAVWMLPDLFSDAELVDALTNLWQNPEKRLALGAKAQAHIHQHHNPRSCAYAYAEAIEATYQKAESGSFGALRHVAMQEPVLSGSDVPGLARMWADNFPPSPRKPQLLLDISALVVTDLWSGIERVTRALLREIVLNPPQGWQVEAVYATTDQPGYRYARKFLSRFLEIPDDWANDDPVQVWPGDLFFGLDFQPQVISAQLPLLREWRNRGVSCYFVVHDLLPVTMPEVFPEGSRDGHQAWLSAITQLDGALCVSRHVADELYDWLQHFGAERRRPYTIGWFHHGSDLESSAPTKGMPQDASTVLSVLQARPTFLMVGTIEPRKGYLQTLQAFDLLWAEGVDVNLVIVGKEGWTPLPDSARRDIPETVRYLRAHQELGKRLHWLAGISDEYLEAVYATSNCLIAASYDEGFGLPIIEAARHGLPLLVRDIPVFHEVTADQAFFFADSRKPVAIATAVKDWLNLYQQNAHPRSDVMPHQSWGESAQQVLNALLGIKAPYRTWLPDGVIRYWGNDPRLHSQVGERGYGRETRTTGKAGHLIHGPYRHLEAGSYRIALKGTAPHWSGTEFMDIVCDQGKRILLQQELRGMDLGRWQIEIVFTLDSSVSDHEIRLWVDEKSDLTLDSISINHLYIDIKSLKDIEQIVTSDGPYNFAAINKSYIKDLYWSKALYKSWLKFGSSHAPYFIIVPRSDLQSFYNTFSVFHEQPIFIAEEDFFEYINITVPEDWNGWLVQQIVKLGFAKTGFAKKYLTLDSAMIFAKPFDWKEIFIRQGDLLLAHLRDDLYDYLDNVGEKTWLNGSLVSARSSYTAIDNFLGYSGSEQLSYSTHIIFDSNLVECLEKYISENGLDGFVGAINYAPYEFRWYGTFLQKNYRQELCIEAPPFLPIIETISAQEFVSGNIKLEDGKIGFLFQPPASDLINPDEIAV
jgi:glycosyltransferase involved in cell wall biosynthesis